MEGGARARKLREGGKHFLRPRVGSAEPFGVELLSPKSRRVCEG